jgi:hypothetical protein
MRASGPRRLLVYCGDYKCAHSVAIDAVPWPDHVRLSDLCSEFTCQACGHRGADVRPLFAVDKSASGIRPPLSRATAQLYLFFLQLF